MLQNDHCNFTPTNPILASNFFLLFFILPLLNNSIPKTSSELQFGFIIIVNNIDKVRKHSIFVYSYSLAERDLILLF